eukprot:COSAG05_NODE_15943_length_357_cov_0.937984_1_plen_28_part_10
MRVDRGRTRVAHLLRSFSGLAEGRIAIA